MTPSFRFKDWEVLPNDRLLRVGGAPVAIGARAFDLLMALIARDGAIVTKDELLVEVWPGLVVEENNLSVQIAALRKVIGSDAIGTVTGRGYRLAAKRQVEELAQASRLLRSDIGPVAVELFGREGDESALFERISEASLVSIVGTGGIGKTALAKSLAARCAAERGETVYWIDLAPLADGTQLVLLAAKVLGVEVDGSTATADLIQALGNLQAVVVIDNCEHVLDAVAELVRCALDRNPGLHWIATSQEPLDIQGEVVYRLRPLDIPPAQASVDEAQTYGAMALLCKRARLADRDFELDDASLATAIDLCRQLDGLPLALEMAAARIASLGLEGVRDQLGHRLRVLTGSRDSPPRHLSLRSTFDWSYALLSEDERKVFRRLEPFVGGFDLDMATRVTRDDDQLPDLDVDQARQVIGTLVDKSLIHRPVDDARRYYLFESARDYARERLADSGDDVEALRRRHAVAVAERFARGRVEHDQLRDAEWTARYQPDRYNLRAALAWACGQDDADLLAGLVAALAHIDLFMREPNEILRFEIPMALLDKAKPALRAAAHLEYGWAHFNEGSCRIGTEHALLALREFEELGDSAGTCRALTELIRLYESRPGMVNEAHESWRALSRIDRTELPLRTRLSCDITAGMRYQGQRTPERLREWESVARAAGFNSMAAECSIYAADDLLIQQRFGEAVTSIQEELARGESRPRFRGTMLNNLVLALVQLGRMDEAVHAARDALRALPSRAHLIFNSLALGAARARHSAEAAMILGYCQSVGRSRERTFDPAEASVHEEALGLVIDALGRSQADELLSAGALLTTAEVAAMSLASASRGALES